MKLWITQKLRSWRMRLAIKWAERYGYYIVKMKQVSGVNYIVDGDGNYLKIGRAPSGAKRSIKG